MESYGADGDESVGGSSCATNEDLRSDGRKKGPQHHKGFAAATAEVTGESKAQINRNVARAEAIGPDILKLSGTSQVQAVVPNPTKLLQSHQSHRPAKTSANVVLALSGHTTDHHRQCCRYSNPNRGNKMKRGNKWGNKSHFSTNLHWGVQILLHDHIHKIPQTSNSLRDFCIGISEIGENDGNGGRFHINSG